MQRCDIQIEHKPSHFGGCLTATCDKWENGNSISSIDTGHASIEHGTKTDSDLARSPDSDHPVSQQASPGVPLGEQRAAGDRRRGTHSRIQVTRSEANHGPRMRRPGRLGDRGGAGRLWTGSSRLKTGAGGLGVYPGPRRHSVASGHYMCDLHMHMYRYDRAEVVLTLLDPSDFKVMPLNRRFSLKQRI